MGYLRAVNVLCIGTMMSVYWECGIRVLGSLHFNNKSKVIPSLPITGDH